MLYTPAISAPLRSQYHSVGRLRVPQSPHLRVLATAAAALGEEVAGAGAWVSRGGALVAVDEKPPDGRRGVSSDTDFRKVSSSTSAATGSDWVGCGLGAERAGGAAGSAMGSATCVTSGASTTSGFGAGRGGATGCAAG